MHVEPVLRIVLHVPSLYQYKYFESRQTRTGSDLDCLI
jgi:hypothetical protein